MIPPLNRAATCALSLAFFAMFATMTSACIFAVDTSSVDFDADTQNDAGDAGDVGEDATTCSPPREQALCEQYELECGEYEVLDDCGQTRSIACGTCLLNDTCISGVCICQPESRDEFCARNSAQCGITEGVDRCDNERRVFCGECGANEVCPPASEPEQAQLCQAEEVCSPACDAGESCIDEQCVCTSPSDEELCAEHIAEQPDAQACGELTMTDRCGVERSVDCGGCADEAQSCSTANLCCVPQSDEELCAQNQRECGTLDITDSCGERRVISCGGCGTQCCNSGVCEPRALGIFC